MSCPHKVPSANLLRSKLGRSVFTDKQKITVLDMILKINEDREKEHPDIKQPIMCTNNSTICMTLNFSTSMLTVDERHLLNTLNNMYIKDSKADPEDMSNTLQRTMENTIFTDMQKVELKEFMMNIAGEEFNQNIICINGPEYDSLNVDLSELTEQQCCDLTKMVEGFVLANS